MYSSKVRSLIISSEEDSDSGSSCSIKDSERNFFMFEEAFEMFEPLSFPWKEETKKYVDFFVSSDCVFSSCKGFF